MVNRLRGSRLVTPSLGTVLLAAAAHSPIAMAAPSFLGAMRSFPADIVANGGTLRFNAVENNFASGTFPLQTFNAQVTAARNFETFTGTVSQFRNCVTVTLSAGDPDLLTLTLTAFDGDSQGGVALGQIRLTTDSAVAPPLITTTDSDCGDPRREGSRLMADAAQTSADRAITINVLANDAPAPDRPVVVPGAGVTQNGGTATVNQNGTITYRPAPGFVGTDSFDYQVLDYFVDGFEGLNAPPVTVTIAVSAAMTPTDPTNPDAPTAPLTARILVNGAPTVAVTDKDFLPGEMVQFDGSSSVSNTGGDIVNFDWFVGDADAPAQSGPNSRFATQLPDGQSQIRLVVTDAGGMTASSSITVTVAAAGGLAALPTLTPNQSSTARATDNLCTKLSQRDDQQQALSDDQRDLLIRCQALIASDAGSQVVALQEMSAEDFNGARTQTLLFTNSVYTGVTDRLLALRGGVKGVSIAGLRITVDGQNVPLADIGRAVGEVLGGGAAADDEPGSLFGEKWGGWSRGNITFGTKERSNEDVGFEAKQFSAVLGMDYRLSDKAVIGGALSFGSSNLTYGMQDEGGLDTKSWAATIYGSRYAGKRFYLDGVINIAQSDFEAQRRIIYTDATGTVDRTAIGNTDGRTLSGGLSGGYDITWKGLSLTPNVNVFYTDSTVNGFRERGSAGLDLVYDDQDFQSLTASLGLRTSYAFNLPWGVIMPYLRTEYVRELQDSVEVFNVQFANDTNDDPTPPIVVRSNQPDKSYLRLAGGLSAQFPFGISGYAEYTRLQGFEFVNFNDFSLGFRLQFKF